MKTCLVIGADSSVGYELLKYFSKQGYRALGTTRRNENLRDQNILSVNFDDPISLNEMISEVGSIDIVIFCIGFLPGKEIREYSDDDFFDVLNSNVLLVMKVLRSLSAKINRDGVVLFMGSIAGSAGSFDEAYAASKAALVGLTKSLAKKSKNGVRFNCIAPGLIKGSRMFEDFTAEEVERHEQQTPVGKLLALEDLVRICFDISQPHWSSLNGQVIDINGGRYV